MAQGQDFPQSSTREKAKKTARRPPQEKCLAPRELCTREQGTDREQWMLPSTPRPRQGSRGNSRGERHAVLEEEPGSNAALIPLQRRAEPTAPEHSPPTQEEGSRAHTPGSPAPLCRPRP